VSDDSMRRIGKTIGRGLATVIVAPALLSFFVRSRLIGRDRALEGSTQALALVPGLVGQYLRRAFLSRVLQRCHRTATIEFGTIFSKADACLDEHVYVGPRCHLGLVHLEHDVLLAAGVHVPSGGDTHGHVDPDVPIRDQAGVRRLVRIGAGSWIGSAAVVMSDVGCDTIVGAGAVVTRPLPDRVVAGGVPARVIRQRGEPAFRA
jgi:virginiamycin A acetyltransferase